MTIDIYALTNAHVNQNCNFAPKIKIGPLSAWGNVHEVLIKRLTKMNKTKPGQNVP